VKPGSEQSYAGSPHGAHAYWRFVSLRADNDDAVALAAMQFRAAPGGADQATGGTPTASSSWDGILAPDKAFDDNAATLWSAANNSNWGWLRYQFAAPVEIGEVAIIARSDVAPDTSPGEFAIQSSDDGDRLGGRRRNRLVARRGAHLRGSELLMKADTCPVRPDLLL
jgi:hypothetical protein